MSISLSDITASLPQLKTGIVATTHRGQGIHSQEIYVGSQKSGIFLPASSHIILKAFNGERTLAEIARVTQTPLEEVLRIVQQLSAANFLDRKKTQIALPNRFESARSAKKVNPLKDGAMRTLQERIIPELQLTTWYLGVSDGGVEKIMARAHFPIIITSKNRLAMAVAAALYGSGFNSILMIDKKRKRKHSGQVQPADVMGGYLRMSDVGGEKDSAIREMALNSSLFPIQSPVGSAINPRLIISLGRALPDYLQRWMSEDVPFLIVNNFSHGTFEIGPFVIPGKSPCPRCIFLTQLDQSPHHHDVEQALFMESESEIPAALTWFAAGVIALAAIQYADNGVSDGVINGVAHEKTISQYLGRTLEFTPTSLSTPRQRQWNVHPHCGCTWR